VLIPQSFPDLETYCAPTTTPSKSSYGQVEASFLFPLFAAVIEDNLREDENILREKVISLGEGHVSSVLVSVRRRTFLVVV
jgi:hypothetical protein